MHLGFNNFHATYSIDGLQLQTVSEEKDLGVIMSDNIKWWKQCSSAVLKANRILGMIKRNLVDRSSDTIIEFSKATSGILQSNLESTLDERHQIN